MSPPRELYEQNKSARVQLIAYVENICAAKRTGGMSVADFEPKRDGKPSHIKLKETDETRPQHPLVMKHEIKAIWGMRPIFERLLKRNNLPVGVAAARVSTTVRHDGALCECVFFGRCKRML